MRFNNILHQLTCPTFFLNFWVIRTQLLYHIIMSISSAALAFGIRKEKETVLIRSLRYIVYSFDYVGASCRCCVYLWIQDVLGRETQTCCPRLLYCLIDQSQQRQHQQAQGKTHFHLRENHCIISVLLSIPVHLLRNYEYIYNLRKRRKKKRRRIAWNWANSNSMQTL